MHQKTGVCSFSDATGGALRKAATAGPKGAGVWDALVPHRRSSTFSSSSLGPGRLAGLACICVATLVGVEFLPAGAVRVLLGGGGRFKTLLPGGLMLPATLSGSGSSLGRVARVSCACYPTQARGPAGIPLALSRRQMLCQRQATSQAQEPFRGPTVSQHRAACQRQAAQV
jgi:hypothetical protein